MAWTALAVSLIEAIAPVAAYHDITKSLGDTDDAMRLVLVRQLRPGGGWYDQLVLRPRPSPALVTLRDPTRLSGSTYDRA